MKNSSEKTTKENKKNSIHIFLFFIPWARKYIAFDLIVRGIDLFAVKRD